MEDYLTELFAEVLETSGLLYEFVSSLTSIKLNEAKIREVTTQKSYSKQDNHATDSRPDLMIRFSDSGQPHVVFIENKLGTGEGQLQLKRYADHLTTYEADGCVTHLIYITKFHDPKKKNEIILGSNSATFTQIRWYEIYNWLNQHENDFIKLFRHYMEEMHLNETRRFVPQDIYAIQHMERLIRMMDSCLDGRVEEKVTTLFSRSTGWTNRFAQLKDANRYMKANDQGNFSVINFGFYLTEEEYPLISIIFEVNPKCPHRAELIKAMKDFIDTHDGWEHENLDDNTAWASIYSDKSLLDFLSADDHIESIQSYFIIKLNELHGLKKQHPEFDWK